MSLTTLHYAPIVPATATASSAASGYPATNVLLGKVARTWRSATALNAETLTIDMGANVTFANATLTVSGTNIDFLDFNGGTTDPPSSVIALMQPTAIDAQGRRKISVIFSGTYRYIKIGRPFGTILDGAPYFFLGPVDIFKSVVSLPRDPLFGESSLDVNYPQSSIVLDNGAIVKDDTGPSYMTPTLNFSGGSNDDHEQIAMLARAGLCWLDLGIASNRGLQWRVKHYEAKTTRKLTAFNRESVQITLKEEV